MSLFYFTVILFILSNTANGRKVVISSEVSIDSYMFNESLIASTKKMATRPTIRIVMFDKIKGYLNWHQDWFKEAAEARCTTKCILLDERSDVSKADVVLFHAPTHGRSAPRFPPNAPPDAIFVLLSMEQPMYAKLLSDKSDLKANFDMLATYSLSSKYPGTSIPNLPLTYYPLNILSVDAVMQPTRPFAKKTGYGTGVMVAVFVSNCHAAGATQRYEYLQQLMKLIRVHSYGKCFNNREEPQLPDDPHWPVIAQRRGRKVKVLSKYKFYLAFENLAVPDYVSEKTFEGYFAGAVSVYRGTSNIHRFMPSNDSFIDANGLSPTQLAALLTRLGNDEKEYEQYFAYKRRPLSMDFVRMARMSYTHPNAACRLCEVALSRGTASDKL